MPAAVIAVAAAVGAEMIGGATLMAALSSSTVWAKAALSIALSFVSEALQEAPQQNQSPISSEIQARKQLIRASAAPRRAVYGETRVSGNLLYVANGTDTSYVHFVIALAGHRCHAINDSWLGDEKVGALDGDGNCTDGRFAGHVRIRKYLGTTDQVMDPDLAAECPEWGAKDRPGKGICYVYLRIKRNRSVFPQGIPTPRFDVQGKADILDVRTSTAGYTSNAALCALDWILWRHGFASALDEVVQATWIAAANVCDEDVALPEAAGGGTQKRYAINGSFTLDRGRAAVLDQMRQAMAGAAFYTMGSWYGHAGAADSPVMDISERDLRGPYRIRPRVPDDKVYNAVRGTYTETAQYTETDFPPIVSPTYQAQDGGERIYKDVELPFENDPYRAQRLAKTDLERHRQGSVVDLPLRIKGLRLRPWNIIRLTLAAPGYEAKLFRIVDWKFNLFAGPDIVVEEYADAIYSWSSIEAAIADPAPDTTLANPLLVGTPSIPVVAESLYETTGSAGAKARAAMSWPAHADPFVVDYLPEYRPAAGSWAVLPPVLGLGTDINDIAPGDYEFRYRARNGLGVISDYSPVCSIEILGLTAPPADVAGFSVIKINGEARAAWDLHADLDVRIGGAIVIRHAPASTGAAWGDGVVVEEFPGKATSGPLALMTGTYMAKARDSADSGGNYSANAVSFVCTEGMVTGWTTAGTLTLAPTFAGTLTGCAVVGGNLELDAALSGTADFSTVLDLGTSAVRRIQASIAAVSFDVADNIDGDDDFDSPEDMDGAAVNDCDVTLYAATTADDPSGTPTWSPWAPFFVADFEARALKFRAVLTAGVISHNIAITALDFTAREPV